MEKILRVGILQFESSGDKLKNVERILTLAKRVEADIVVLPEYSMLNIAGRSPVEVYEASEAVDGPYISEFKKFARENSTYVLVTLLERATYPKVYNTAVVISPDEKIVTIYRKIHLFDALGVRESDYMTPGDKPGSIFDVKGAKLTIAICFDLRFPELFRYYGLQGAEVVLVPSAWYSGPMKEEVIRFLARARASENTYYVVVANQYSTRFTGRSMVIDPLGTVLLDLGLGEKYVEFDIDVSYVYQVRKSLPLLELRRNDIYTLSFCNRSGLA